MFIPEPIDAQDCRAAMSAALTLALEHRGEWEAVFCPGMGTGVGPVATAACRQSDGRSLRRRLGRVVSKPMNLDIGAYRLRCLRSLQCRHPNPGC